MSRCRQCCVQTNTDKQRDEFLKKADEAYEGTLDHLSQTASTLLHAYAAIAKEDLPHRFRSNAQKRGQRPKRNRRPKCNRRGRSQSRAAVSERQETMGSEVIGPEGFVSEDDEKAVYEGRRLPGRSRSRALGSGAAPSQPCIERAVSGDRRERSRDRCRRSAHLGQGACYEWQPEAFETMWKLGDANYAYDNPMGTTWDVRIHSLGPRVASPCVPQDN